MTDFKQEVKYLEKTVEEYHQLSKIKRRDFISSLQSKEWHAELTYETTQDPEKLKQFVHEEVFLCFQRQFAEIRQLAQ